MTLGEKIAAARKKKSMSQAQLGNLVGLAQNAISNLENDALKTPPDAATLIRISEALDCSDILLHHCDTCPVRQHILLKKYPDLNHIRPDPVAIAARLVSEMQEGAAAMSRLMTRFTDLDFQKQPDYMQAFMKEMEQVIDVERGIEILKFEMLRSGLHTAEDLRAVERKQQAKCEARGYHHNGLEVKP